MTKPLAFTATAFKCGEQTDVGKGYIIAWRCLAEIQAQKLSTLYAGEEGLRSVQEASST